MDAVLAASRPYRNRLNQQTKHLAVANGNIDFGTVTLILFDLDVVVQTLHRGVVVEIGSF